MYDTARRVALVKQRVLGKHPPEAAARHLWTERRVQLLFAVLTQTVGTVVGKGRQPHGACSARCCCVGTLCISAAPAGGDLAGHDSLAFGAEENGRSVTSPQQKAPWDRLHMLLICFAISTAINRLSSALRCG